MAFTTKSETTQEEFKDRGNMAGNFPTMSDIQIKESGEAANTNFIVIGLTRLGLKPTIYCTQGEHANHYTTDPTTIRSRP